MTNPVQSLTDYAVSWRRSLRAENKSPRTIEAYMLATTQLAAFLNDPPVVDVSRRDVEAFIEQVLDTRSSATAKQRYMSLRNFFGWLVDDEEINDSPMAKMKPPKVEEKPPPVLTPDEFDALLKTASGKSFVDRRDRAVLLLLADTGMRASELTGLHVEDVDLDLQVAHIEGKGGKFRAAPFGYETSLALDRYIRLRSHHTHARDQVLFLGERGPLTRSGLGSVVRRRGREAGIEGLHPHLLRHTFVHRWLAEGGQEGDVTRILGWSRKSSAQMLDRYGASAATERAHAAHKRLGPVDNR